MQSPQAGQRRTPHRTPLRAHTAATAARSRQFGYDKGTFVSVPALIAVILMKWTTVGTLNVMQESLTVPALANLCMTFRLNA